MTDHHDLYKAAKRISEIFDDGQFSEVSKIERLPNFRADAINGLVISKRDYHRKMTEEEESLAQRVFSAMKRHERARGEQERRDGLLKLSQELETIRSVLPAMAATLSIEMGVKARELAARAALVGKDEQNDG